MISLDSITINPVPFDTEHFGFCCANVVVPSETRLSALQVSELQETARQQGFRFLSIASPIDLDFLKDNAAGVLCEYSGSFEAVRRKADSFKKRFDVKPVTSDNWKDIVALTEFRASNRFSNDKGFDEKLVFEHKLKMFKVQWERFPKLGYIAYSTAGEPLGFHLCVRDAADIKQYDIVIRPEFRTGLLAIELIAACLNAASTEYNDLLTVSTKIYADNKESDGLFSKLGVTKNDRESHYYHFWL